MPRFFFDFHGAQYGMRDEEGCEFDDLELAYLDAYRSMVRIGAEQLLEQVDPSQQWIDIRDESGANLMTVAFDEVFRRRAQRSPTVTDGKFRKHVENSRRLRREIREACVLARASVLTARETLNRAQSRRSASPWFAEPVAASPLTESPGS